MNTSPLIAVTCAFAPATTGASPGGRMSHASPTLSPSSSAWPEFATSGQLSLASGIPSLSVSLGTSTTTGGGGGGGGAVQVTLTVPPASRATPSEATKRAASTSVPATALS